MKKLYFIVTVCFILSSCGGMPSKPKVTMELNGRWSGLLPDESGAFYMVIGGDGVRIIDITGIPNCGEYIVYFQEPQYVIEDNTFFLETQYLSISGTFNDENSADGKYEIKCGDESFTNTWNATKGRSVILTPTSQTYSMPKNKIDKDLFLPNGGTSGFGQSPLEPYSKGDWDLSVFRATNAYIPIPRGWTVIEMQNQMVIFPDLNDSDGAYPITIVLGLLGSESDNKPIEDALSDAGSQTNSEISLTEIIDSQKGYIFGDGQLNTGEQIYDLIIISKDHLRKYNYFRVISFTDKWVDYYQIVKDMVSNWSLADGTIMGVSLPDSLAK